MFTPEGAAHQNKKQRDELCKLLREARKIIKADACARSLHKDFLQRSADLLKGIK